MTPAEQAAVDAQKKAAEVKNTEPVIIEGDAKLGGPFTIRGEDFGGQGTLTIGGTQVKTTRWDNRSIKGTLPAGLVGDVTLTGTFGTRHGTWPHVPPVATKTTTTVVETVPATAK